MDSPYVAPAFGRPGVFCGHEWYGQRFAYRNSTIRGFQTVVEEISGENLEVFFQEWIYGSGYPQLRFAWSFNPLPYEGYKIELTVKQVQHANCFSSASSSWLTAETDTLMDRFDLQGLGNRPQRDLAPRNAQVVDRPRS
jgi:hypothetical protein